MFQVLSQFIAPYTTALVVFIGGWFLLYLFKKILISRLVVLAEKTKNNYDDIIVNALHSLHPIVLGIAALAFSLRFATVPIVVINSVNAVFLIAIVYQVAAVAAQIVDTLIKSRKGLGGSATAMSFIATIVKVLMWSFGGLVVLSNLGVNITSLIAGLGIGGVAIAFALQQILGDLFSSFAIQLDKPFEVGDMIVVGDHRGVVEKIGIKSTRIRSLQGEEIVIGNQDLTSARIQNFRKLKERRATFTFGILYETPLDKIRTVPSMVQKIIESVENTKFDRVFFTTFGPSSLDFEAVYYIPSDDYKTYLAAQEEINLKMMEAFAKEKIEFAYPTQTLYLKK